MERVCIFIDASNLYHCMLKKTGIKEVDFNFEDFAKFLARDREIIENGKCFYVGTVREKGARHETKRAMANQNKLFSRLISCDNWRIETSKLRTRLETIKIDDRVNDYKKLAGLGIKEIQYERSREKGIDVKIAVDLISGAVNDKYDTAILVSSDTDLVPAIDFIRNKYDKKVEYIGFSVEKTESFQETKPVKRMIYATDIQRVLVEADIKPFIIKSLL